MRKCWVNRWRVLIALVIIFCLLAPVAVKLDNKPIGAERIQFISLWTVFNGSFDHSALPRDLSNTFVIRANQTPVLVNLFVNKPRQSQPLWELVPYQVNHNLQTGFFLTALLIGYFFSFYRNARNLTHDDSDDPNLGFKYKLNEI